MFFLLAGSGARRADDRGFAPRIAMPLGPGSRCTSDSVESGFKLYAELARRYDGLLAA
jgi:hypothetical protein